MVPCEPDNIEDANQSSNNDNLTLKTIGFSADGPNIISRLELEITIIIIILKDKVVNKVV